MGLCFIGKRKFSRFISQYIPNNIGYIKSIETNEILGEHYGLHCYTVGQRITPMNRHYKSSKPLFIAKKDLIDNIIYVVNIYFIFKPIYRFVCFFFVSGTRYKSSSIIYKIFSYRYSTLD